MKGIVSAAMKISAKSLIVSVVVAVAAGANAQISASAGGVGIGGSIGYLYPQDSAMKAAFGSSIVRIGLGPTTTESRQQGIVPSWEVISAAKNGNRMLLIPITYGIEKSVGDKGPFRPYYRVYGGLAYMDYSVTTAALHEGRRFGAVYGLELGINLGSLARVSARYNAFAKQDGLNFNHVELVASYTIFKL